MGKPKGTKRKAAAVITKDISNEKKKHITFNDEDDNIDDNEAIIESLNQEPIKYTKKSINANLEDDDKPEEQENKDDLLLLHTAYESFPKPLLPRRSKVVKGPIKDNIDSNKNEIQTPIIISNITKPLNKIRKIENIEVTLLDNNDTITNYTMSRTAKHFLQETYNSHERIRYALFAKQKYKGSRGVAQR